MISAITGGFLLVTGLHRRSAAGWGAAALGGVLVRRAVTGHSNLLEALGLRTASKGQGAETTSVPYELGVRVDESITINRPRAEVYRFWRNFSNFPRFMRHVQSVRQDEGGRTHWVVNAPAGRTVEWDAVIHNEADNERIAWRTLPGADVDHAGSVWFRDTAGGTQVKVALQYNPPGGAVGAVLSQLWGEEPSQQIREDLRRLKEILESAEGIQGQPQDTGSDKDWEVHEASEESFPASDAPAYTR